MFSCDHCNKSFYTNYGLSGHKRIHSGNQASKPIRCSCIYTQKEMCVYLLVKYQAALISCKHCSKLFKPNASRKIFCKSSCAATFNNKLRLPRTIESCSKTSKALKGQTILKTRRVDDNIETIYRFTAVIRKICNGCGKYFYTKGTNLNTGRRTCNEDCARDAIITGRAFKHGKMVHYRYFNHFENKEIILESSWEVTIADFLTENDINWIRPQSIKWVDQNNKVRRYYPDFYLPLHDIYLDPKNKFCVQQDTYKLSVVSTQINLKFGEISYLKEEINKLITQNSAAGRSTALLVTGPKSQRPHLETLD